MPISFLSLERQVALALTHGRFHPGAGDEYDSAQIALKYEIDALSGKHLSKEERREVIALIKSDEEARKFYLSQLNLIELPF